MIMPPSRLELRPRLQAVGALDRVVDARDQHVVPIRINTRRTRWKSKRMDVNASASHAANILYLALSLSFSFFSSFFLCVKGFFCHRGSGCYMYNTSITHKALKESRAHERNYCFFFCLLPPSFPSFLPSRHDEPNPTHHMYSHIPSHRVSPIGSC
jgi:hypothetical protein